MSINSKGSEQLDGTRRKRAASVGPPSARSKIPTRRLCDGKLEEMISSSQEQYQSDWTKQKPNKTVAADTAAIPKDSGARRKHESGLVARPPSEHRTNYPQSYIPNKHRPAVKDLSRTRPKSVPPVKRRHVLGLELPIKEKKSVVEQLRASGRSSKPNASTIENNGNTIATTQPAGLVTKKGSTSAQLSNTLKVYKIPIKESTNQSPNLTVTPKNHEQVLREGRRDPYDFLSESETNHLPQYKFVPAPNNMSGNTASSSRVKPRSTIPSRSYKTPPLPMTARPDADAEPSTSNFTSNTAHLSEDFDYSQPRTSAQILPGAQIISHGDSRNGIPNCQVAIRGQPSVFKRASSIGRLKPAEIPAGSTIISLDDYSNDEIATIPVMSSRPHPVSLNYNVYSQRTPARIPPDANIISLTRSSSSEADEEESEMDDVSVPVQPSAKAIEKRALHPANSHLNIVDDITSSAAQMPSHLVSTTENSKDPIPINGNRRAPTNKTKYDPMALSADTCMGKLLADANKNIKTQRDISKDNEDHQRLANHKQPVKASRRTPSSNLQDGKSRQKHSAEKLPFLGNFEKGVNATAQQEVTAQKDPITRSKARSQDSSRHGSKYSMTAARGVSNRSHALRESELPKREQAHNVPKTPEVAKGSRSAVGGRYSSRAAIDKVGTMTTIKFGKKGRDKPIPESFLKESKYSDDEYRPLSSASEQSSDDELNDDQLRSRAVTPLLHPMGSTRSSSQPGSSRKLRSGSYTKPAISFTPIDNLSPKIQGHESVAKRDKKFGQGYSKRVRDAFSDGSVSCSDPDLEKTEPTMQTSMLQLGLGLVLKDQRNDEDVFATRLSTHQRKPWWEPLKWIQKYETTFLGDRTGRLWFADGPFKGYIWSGPGEGGYMPSCKAPDDKMLARAEGTAVFREKFGGQYSSTESSDADYQDGDFPEQDDSEHDALPSTRGSRDDTRYPSSDINRDSDIPSNDRLSPVNSSKEGSYHTAPLPSTPPGISLQKQRSDSPTQANSTDQIERMERTKQYVLTGSPVKPIESRAADCPSVTRSQTLDRLLAELAPTTGPERVPSPPSAESETTSVLITRQLMSDCPPPSNQELAELMSSSPTNMRARASSPGQGVDGEGGYDTSSSDPSSGIPARIIPGTPQPPATPRNRSVSFRLEHPSATYILNGIAERRTARSLTDCSPPAYRSNQRVRNSIDRIDTNVKIGTPNPVGETPTKPARKLTNTSKAEPTLDSDNKEPSINANIVVELPTLTIEKHDEHHAISLIREADDSSRFPPKSFEEINGATSRANAQPSYDSDAETLSYVLHKSPRWLNSITQIGPLEEGEESSDAATDMPKPFAMMPARASTGKSAAAAKKVILCPDGEIIEESSTPDSDRERLSGAIPRVPRRAPKVIPDSGAKPSANSPMALKREEIPAEDDTAFNLAHSPSDLEDSSKYIQPPRKKRKLTMPIAKTTRVPKDTSAKTPDNSRLGTSKPYLKSTTPIPLPSIPLLSQGYEAPTRVAVPNPPAGFSPAQQLQQRARKPVPQSTTPIPLPVIPTLAGNNSHGEKPPSGKKKRKRNSSSRGSDELDAASFKREEGRKGEGEPISRAERAFPADERPPIKGRKTNDNNDYTKKRKRGRKNRHRSQARQQQYLINRSRGRQAEILLQ
ncbi:hypothetical protein AAE478_000008 [Parahypoxylon ruwenzoriense]